MVFTKYSTDYYVVTEAEASLYESKWPQIVNHLKPNKPIFKFNW